MKSLTYRVSQKGEAELMRLDEAEPCGPGCGFTWVHIDGNDPACVEWLEQQSGIAPAVVAAMRAIETRPRATPIGDGVLVNLRGVNAQPDADPDDLVSVRLWAEPGRVVTVNYRPLLAVDDLKVEVESGRVEDPGDLVATLAGVMTARLDPVIASLADTLDALEEQIIDGKEQSLRERIARSRRVAITLRRYISPQREALQRLTVERLPFFDDVDRLQIAEAGNRVTRMIEELDASRERAAVLSDQLSDLRAESVANRTLVLSVVSAVFLPLSFFAGLIGMNLEGIPFNAEPWSFGAYVGVSLMIGLLVYLWLRLRGWF